MNYLRLVGVYLRINFMGELAYRVNFLLQLFQSVLELATALLGLRLVFSYTDSLCGWTADEMVVLVGVYIMAGGVIGLVIEPSLEQFIASVRDGVLDFTLIKPKDAQFMISLQKFNVWKLIDVALGAAVVATALVRLGSTVGPLQGLSFAVMLLAGLVVIYSFWLMLATLSFWFVRLENILSIFQSMYEAGRWPLSLYPGWLRFALTFVVPVAFATTIPAQALTGRLAMPSLIGAVALAVGLTLGSRLFWLFGLRHYSGASA